LRGTEQAEITRKLAAVVLADIEGYSRLMADDELGTHRQFRRHIEGLAKPLLEIHRGQLVKTTGDGFLVMFDTADQAVDFAIEFQAGVESQNSDVPASKRLQFRLGINMGEIIIEEEDVFGEEVNLAARLEPLAPAGGIVVSQFVYQSACGRHDCQFQELGELQLKNISRPVTAYRMTVSPERKSRSVVAPAHRAGAVQSSDARPSPNRKPSLVVLPFKNLGGDVAHEYFCDGLTSDLIADLSKFDEMEIVTLQATLTHKDEAGLSQQIGTALGVDYALDGSVQKNLDSVRINARLLDVRTTRIIWSERFDRRFDDIFLVQDDIVQAVAGSLPINVSQFEHRRAIRKRLADMNAYDAFLRGRYLWDAHIDGNETRESLEECRKWLRLALQLDAQYGPPMSMLAYTYAWGWRQGWDDDSALELAEEYAKKALELEPNSYDVHWDLAYYYSTVRDFDNALEQYDIAYRLNRNDPLLMVEIAEFYSYLGRAEEGFPLVRKAMQINPNPPNYYIETMAWLLYFVGDYRGGLREIARLRKHSYSSRLMEAVLHAQLEQEHLSRGEADQAREQRRKSEIALERFRASRPDWTIEKELRACIFQSPEVEARWIHGLKLVNLPGGGD